VDLVFIQPEGGGRKKNCSFIPFEKIAENMGFYSAWGSPNFLARNLLRKGIKGNIRKEIVMHKETKEMGR
jgi:hypothetical protein